MKQSSVFLDAQHYGYLKVEKSWVYTPGGSPKIKGMVYTPMGGSPTINVMVYAYFGGSPKIKVQPFILVGSWMVKNQTK